ncbi:mannose-1-phosphate guanylyltransferase/mannose-6-phosphate isomerase [Microvirga sp. 17 mud 1-3]|uniref:mannose-1-phosphate guanylyltransferase/mannose-6-phosphate isomerase n=1 Tax=Microvirga sp. 17 mud 1-3 TaxID=2082949 RepID=UPI000D6CB048|nr:mannose-1-phosphate guanylyltransferase/mannose-6-phosphate isomerase [Microvirga sp. 17 mud 1-3]AWM86127.1 mannose-1-phosphate guanylyltransferase/mannose-6-phosphate isomerase [Microvirga sp. 17 mud 1-3]
MRRITPVLLAGGSGSRLWPLSRQNLPKPLLPLIGNGTPLQKTAERLRGIDFYGEPLVMAQAEHRFAVAEQLQSVGTQARIVLEPVSRNTAPAAAVAALIAGRDDPEAILLVMPTDHDVPDAGAFHGAVEKGLAAAQEGAFVLFGVAPSGPETGFGYIRLGRTIGGHPEVHTVEAFKEKPDRAAAEHFCRSGSYVWNSGIFLLPVRPFLDELARLDGELLQACRDAVAQAASDPDFIRLDAETLARAPSISLDYAVLERTDRAVAVAPSFPWCDMGTWAALWKRETKDERANALLGNVLARDTQGSYIRSDGPFVATLGIENLIVVATPDAVLVADRESGQEVRRLVEEIEGLACMGEG